MYLSYFEENEQMSLILWKFSRNSSIFGSKYRWQLQQIILESSKLPAVRVAYDEQLFSSRLFPGILFSYNSRLLFLEK